MATILYVEDEETDRELMEMAFEREGLAGVLQTVNNGRAAIHYLQGVGLYADRRKHPLPAVVLLDLNLPEVHGFAVLEWIRSSPDHRPLPVVVFSSSERENDRERAKELGANSFIQKPNSLGLFQQVARQLGQRWLR